MSAPAVSSPIEPQAQQLVAERYELSALVGRGGMGEVWAAHDRVLERQVAIKLMLPDRERGGRQGRLLREARAAAAIDSPHVARVFDADPAAKPPFIAMELLDGRSLAEELAARGNLPIDEACGLLLQACAGVAAAHAAGVVHRDLKPSNLFLVPRPGEPPLVKVLDFGIAKLSRRAAAPLTDTGRRLGTPGYLAPEQLRDTKSSDARADIWALGLVLFEALAGRRAFEAADEVEYAAMILTEAPTPIERVVPQLPEAVAAAVHRCLRREPSQRFAEVVELARALAPFAEPRTLPARLLEQMEQDMPSAAERESPALPSADAAAPTADSRDADADEPTHAEPDEAVPAPARGHTGGWLRWAGMLLAVATAVAWLSWHAGPAASRMLPSLGALAASWSYPGADSTDQPAGRSTDEDAPPAPVTGEPAPAMVPDTDADVDTDADEPSARPAATAPPSATALAAAKPSSAPPASAAPTTTSSGPLRLRPAWRPSRGLWEDQL